MKHPIRSMFDEVAGNYDFLNHFLSLNRDKAWRKKAIEHLIQSKTPLGPILDLCGGTGDFIQQYQKITQDRSVSVIGDFSLGMLQKAPAKKVQAHPIQSDALGLPFKSNSFSKVFCGFGVRNLSDLSQGISEVYRVLQPGGVFLVLEFFKPETPWSRFFYNGLAPVVLPPLAGIFRTPKSAYEYLVKSIRAFASVEEFKNKAFEKGFTQGYRIHCDGGVCSIVLLRKPPVPEIPWADI